ncbi:hypothetical protein [Microbacterium kunmingense]|nr:hypothetical protein [Microbacterium kunmingense]
MSTTADLEAMTLTIQADTLQELVLIARLLTELEKVARRHSSESN